MIDRLK